MNTFKLATGRKVQKDASYCVAVKSNGRWSHKFYKTRKGAMNEYSSIRNSKVNRDYYNVTEIQLITALDIR